MTGRLQVVNIFARVDFGTSFDLANLFLTLPGSEYHPEKFHGLILRTADPRSCITLHRSGIAGCTGCRSEEEVYEAVGIVAKAQRGAGYNVGDPGIDIRNIVCLFDLRRPVNLELLSESASGLVDYEPKQFPGAFVRFGGAGVATVFRNGRVRFNGVKSIGQAEQLSRKVFHLIVSASAWSKWPDLREKSRSAVPIYRCS